MSTTQPPQRGDAKAWSQLTAEERKALTPIEKAYARSLDLKLKSAAVDAHIARLEKLARDKGRKRDTRRKIVAGGVILAWAAEPTGPGKPDRAAWLQEILDGRLTREDERALFGLPPRERPAGAENSTSDRTSDGMGVHV